MKLVYKTRIFIIILISLLTALDILAQEIEFDKTKYYKSKNQFFYDLITVPKLNSDSVELHILYRASYNTLKFAKLKSDSYSDDKQVSYPIFEFELRDEDGIIRKREIQKDTVISFYPEIESLDKYIYGSISIVINPGKYSPVIRLMEGDNIKLSEKKCDDVIITSSKGKSLIFNPFFASKESRYNDSLYTPFVINNSISFSSKDAEIFIPLASPKSVKYNYKLDYLDKENSLFNLDGENKISGILSPILDKEILFSSDKRGKGGIYVVSNKTNKILSSFLKITIPADKNYPGNYELTIISSDLKDSLKYRFSIVWENMPICFKNGEYTADVMYYILTDDEYSKIKKGSQREILKKIIEYWKTKDPSPFTLVNEAMNEYFKRVDYAIFNFQTIREKDGAKTERGKIYILYGKPSDIKRNITKDNKLQEIWYYINLKKTFLFETDTNGVLYLTKITDNK